MVIYGYCLLQGANLLSDGSEMLLEILDPGLIGGALSRLCACVQQPSLICSRIPTGLSRWDLPTHPQPPDTILLASRKLVRPSRRFAGLVLPVLGALPDALIIVVSGLGGTAEEAQEQVCRHFASHTWWS